MVHILYSSLIFKVKFDQRLEKRDSKLYICTTQISTAEAFNSSHWAETNLGSKLQTMNKIVDGFFNDFTDTSLFEKGAISSTTGGNSSNTSTTRIRTKTYLSSVIRRINAMTGYKYCLPVYQNGTYKGMWNGTKCTTSATWLTGEIYLELIGDYQFRVVLAKSNDGTIAITDATNFIMSSETDTSLTLPGIPADAARVGEINYELDLVKDVTSLEVHGPNGWTYYGTGQFASGGDITPAAAYNIYYFIANEDFDIWTDNDICDGKNGYLRLYSETPFSSTTYAGFIGSLIKNDSGVVTTDTMPKVDSKVHVTAGQYVALSLSASSTYIRFMTSGGSMSRQYLSDQVILDEAQLQQIESVQIKPVIKKTTNRVDMFIPTSNKKYFINYCFVHVENGISGEVTDNGLGWRMSYVYLCRTNEARSHVKYIAYNGEWEMAVKLDGRSDFIGLGNHGDEIQTMFRMYIDGKSINESDTFDEREFEEIQLICKLTMYDPSDHTTVVGYHTRIDTINAVKKTVTIENKVEWAASYTMGSSYLFMCPISRSHDDVQITDYFIDNQDYILTNCSTTTFDPSDNNNGVGKAKHDVTQYTFWGAGLELFGYAKLLNRKAASGNIPFSTVSSSSSYNKIYFAICSNGDTVSAGDVWRQETEFFLDSGYNPIE